MRSNTSTDHLLTGGQGIQLFTPETAYFLGLLTIETIPVTWFFKWYIESSNYASGLGEKFRIGWLLIFTAP